MIAGKKVEHSDQGAVPRRARRVLALAVCAATALGPLVLVVLVGVLVARSLRARSGTPSSADPSERVTTEVTTPVVTPVVIPVVIPVVTPAARTGPTQNYADPGVVRQRARPALALAVRAGTAVGPVVLALVVGAVAAMVLPPGRVGLPVWLWLVGVVVTTSAVLYSCSRLLRGLAPLSALLRLSLVLPDDVPHRFALARRRWSPAALEVTPGAEEESPSQRLLALVATLAAHDGKTRAHAERVQAYAALIGKEMGLSASDVDRLSWVALLHDVGKVHVPVEVINKAGRPSEEEWAQLQGHPHHGGELVEPLRGWLGDWLDGVEQHHERWDGRGYPRALAGQDISLAARVIAVADTYDVITSARSYKKPMTAEQARAEITRCAGEQFDPAVVRALLSVGIAKLRRIAGPATLLAALPVVIAAPAQAAPSVGAVLQAAGGHAATAVLAAGVGVTGGVAATDVIAAPPGAQVLVVQETSSADRGSAGTTTGATPGDTGHRSSATADGHPGGGGRGQAGPGDVDPPAADQGPTPPPGAPSADPASLAGAEPSASGTATAPSAVATAPHQLLAPPSNTASPSQGSGALADVGPRPPGASAKAPRAATAAPAPGPSRGEDGRPSATASGAPGAAGTRDAQKGAQQPGKSAADAARAAQDSADRAAQQAAKDRADQARAAAGAADKAAAKAAKDAADAAKAAADAAARAAAKKASEPAGRLTGGPSGTSGGGQASAPTRAPAGAVGAPATPATGSSRTGGVIGGVVGEGR